MLTLELILCAVIVSVGFFVVQLWLRTLIRDQKRGDRTPTTAARRTKKKHRKRNTRKHCARNGRRGPEENDDETVC